VSFASIIRRWGHRPWFAAVFRPLVPLDRALGRLTRGRFVALGIAELPSMLLTTVGRRTGQPRTSPLLYVPDGPAYVVIASNWGRRSHPSWSTNLLANPVAAVTVGGRRIPVRAELVTGAERERLWQLLLAIWPAYRTYLQRSGRVLRIFRLMPDQG
jgi:deazaflavin-dependent oxidoreductase (nitroreductase family)